MMDRTNEQPFDRNASSLQHFVQDRPEETILAAFAAGVLVGLMVGVALAESSSAGSRRSHSVAESLGNKVLHSIDKILPDFVAKTLGK